MVYFEFKKFKVRFISLVLKITLKFILLKTRREEEDLMKKLFWLNSSTSPKATTAFKVKAESEAEEAEQASSRFPICTALSPSAKAAKAVAMVSKMGTKDQKRPSLDSGYADSNDCQNRLVQTMTLTLIPL